MLRSKRTVILCSVICVFGVVEYSLYEIVVVIVLNESRDDVPLKRRRAAVEYYAERSGLGVGVGILVHDLKNGPLRSTLSLLSNRWKC
jgi:hypothetical protein